MRGSKHCEKNCKYLNIGISNAGCDKFCCLLNFDGKGLLKCRECLLAEINRMAKEIERLRK